MVPFGPYSFYLKDNAGIYDTLRTTVYTAFLGAGYALYWNARFGLTANVELDFGYQKPILHTNDRFSQRVIQYYGKSDSYYIESFFEGFDFRFYASLGWGFGKR